MIRVNLLPRELRRRRLVLPRELVVVASMVLGWALVMSLGYIWIASHGTRADQLRADAVTADAEAKRLLKQRDNPILAARQEALRGRRHAVEQLRGARQSPLDGLSELAALFDAGPSSAGELAPADVRLLELRVATPTAWQVIGSARDAAALADLVRRLQTSDRFDLSYGPEYARTDGDRLRFRVDLAVAAAD